MTYTRYAKTTAGPNDADNNDPNKNNQNSTEQGGGNPAAKGTVLTIGASQAQYKVTSSDAKNPTVEYKGLTNAGKKKKTITIPTYVTYNGIKYKVTSIAAKCFKNNKELKSVGKTVLKGRNAKCKIKVPSSKVKAYKQVFKSKGQKFTVKIAKL